MLSAHVVSFDLYSFTGLQFSPREYVPTKQPTLTVCDQNDIYFIRQVNIDDII